MGTVYFVGAGPGEPGLLTMRAAALLRAAEIVVAEARLAQRLAGIVGPDAEIVALGEDDGVGQRASVLAEAASRAVVVVRAMEGDPLIQGRGAAEALATRAAGVAIELVPGVLPEAAALAYAGIPALHPGVASVSVLATASDTAEMELVDGIVRAVVEGGGGAVLRLEPGSCTGAVRRLLAAGVPGEIPAALVEMGGTGRARTLTGTLGELAERVSGAGLEGGYGAIIGEVVRLRERLSWIEGRPLFGRQVVVTRSRVQASEFSAALEALGAEVVEFPAIRIEAPGDAEPLRRAARTVASYDWAVFTSVNGVERFWSALDEAGGDARAFGGVRIACVGPATAAALELRGIRPDVVPAVHVAESLVAAIVAATERPGAGRDGAALAGVRFLLPLAAGARPVVAESLRSHGAIVDQVEAYRSVPATGGGEEVRRRLDAREIDAITFTSPSTVEGFVHAVGTETGGAVIAAIGPITAEAARRSGLPVDIVAAEHTIAGLVGALERHFGKEPAVARGV